MTRVIFVFLTFLTSLSFAQKGNPVAVIDFVKIKDNRQKEVLYYYENNWKLYREIALQKNYISSYLLLQVKPDSTTKFDLILMTEYADSAQFKLSEPRFQQIIKEKRPSGPILLNEFKPSEFRQSLFLKNSQTLFSSHKYD